MSRQKFTAQDYKKAWTSPFGLTLLGYYICMAVVGLLIPDNILRDHLWAREFSDFMASIVPQIDRITALSIQPDVNRFYFSVLWATSPLLFSLFFVYLLRRPFNPREWKQAGKPVYESFIFLTVVLIMCGAWPQTLWWVDSESKLSYGLFGYSFLRSTLAQIIFVDAPVVLLAVTPFAFRAWHKQSSPRSNERS